MTESAVPAVSASWVDLDQLLADIEELVVCESPSADLAAIARSAEVVARIGSIRLGAEPERIVVDGVTHLRWRFGRPGVLVLAHHDTVWPLGTLERMPFSASGGVMRGPGCFDMLSGLAMAMHAISRSRPTDGVTLLVTGDEEVGSTTSRALIESEAREASAALVLEASADGGALKTGRKGVSLYEVEVIGRAAHAGLDPERGVNATLELAHQVHRVAALADAAQGTSVTATVCSAGTTTNTVPAGGRFAVDVRAWTVAEQQRVDDGLRRLAPVLPGAGVVVHGGINRPPLEESSSEGLFARARTVASRLGLPEPISAVVGGASDGNFSAGVGTPTLDGLGAVGGGAHAESEHVLVDRLADRTVLLHALIEDLLADRAGEPGGERDVHA